VAANGIKLAELARRHPSGRTPMLLLQSPIDELRGMNLRPVR
jgi:hypothetical protein